MKHVSAYAYYDVQLRKAVKRKSKRPTISIIGLFEFDKKLNGFGARTGNKILERKMY